MDNNKFESFDEFCLRLNEDEKGLFGSLIDKTQSFVPRIMRFAKAKSVMKSYLRGFEKKSLSLIKHFEKNVKAVADNAEDNFKKFMDSKLKDLVALDKIDVAVNLAVSYKKDITSLKETELKKINTYVEKILDSYTSSIDKRIDSPGFILNVELSDRGKGKLKAKWSELSSIKKMEVDEKLLRLLGDAGLETLDTINAELDSFIEEYKYSYGASALDFHIGSIIEIGVDTYQVEIVLRAPGRRHVLAEKGLFIADNENAINDVQSSRQIDMKNLYFGSYTMKIKADPSDYIRPFLKIAGTTKLKFGDSVKIEDLAEPSTQMAAQQPAQTGSRLAGFV